MSEPDIAVVTGASRGIGRFIADQLHSSGYEVIGVARTPPDNVPYEVRKANVGKPEEVKEVLGPLRKDKRVSLLINAAGIASMNFTIATPAETVLRILHTNLAGTIFCCQEIAPALIRRRSGRIINFSTIAVPIALKGESVYAASKAGVEAFTRTFAKEMADFNVTVNVVAPGPVDTDLIAKVPEDSIQEIVHHQIIQRKATLMEVWNTVSTLLLEDANMITGQVINIGGV